MSLSSTASQPLVQIVARVCFPAFARLQEHPEEREQLLVNSLYWLNLVSYPILMVLAAQGSPLVTYVFGEAWRPALWALYAFAFRMMATNVTSVLVGYLNATGRSSLGFRIAAVWTATEWATALGLSYFIGFNGIAAAYAFGVLLPVGWLLAIAAREVNLHLPRTFGIPLLLGTLGALVALALRPFATSLWTFLPILALSAAAPLSLAAFLERRRLEALLKSRLGGWRTAQVPQAIEPHEVSSEMGV
jgi:O-antigen/teichoic acid export membrane protein